MLRTSALILGAVATLSVSGAGVTAQPADIGTIERVAEVVGGGEPVLVKGASDRVQLRRGASGTWMFLGPDSRLIESDRLRVRRYIDVRLRIERPTQRGRLVFLTELLGPTGGRVIDVGATGPQSEYVLGDTLGGGELAVVVESGALVVNWSAGRLAVVAAGIRTVITGTRVAFVMDSTGNTGAMFLEEGSVVFPDFPTVNVGAGDVVQLQRGLPPIVSTPAAAQANALRSAVRYNGDQIWAQFRPFWAKPAFFIPAVGTVAGTAAFLATRWGDEPGPRHGIVIVRIPFP